jgi:hypothetical protein
MPQLPLLLEQCPEPVPEPLACRAARPAEADGCRTGSQQRRDTAMMQLDGSLCHTVTHGRNPKKPRFARRFGNLYPADRRRPIPLLLECL